MVQELTTVTELEEPVEVDGHGWYVGCVDMLYDEYYLHNNGGIYDTCAPRYKLPSGKMVSTGWYKTEIDAYVCSQMYYNKYGLIYPYTNNIPVAVPATNNIESKVMEFE